MQLVKAHAYGNDFLYVTEAAVAAGGHDWVALARRLCERHTGVGADGLIIYDPTPEGARMRLLNADGSASEVSGNGVRGLAALLARTRHLEPGPDADLFIDTDAGVKRVTLLARESYWRFRFRADMGVPASVREVRLQAADLGFRAVALSIGNPQCVLLEPLDERRLAAIGPALQAHPEFPEGVNVEQAEVVAPGHVRILIWERGVGPTRSSGTGSCAAAVAAAAYGGALHDVQVEAPGGTQRVEWSDTGVRLTGWAEVLLDGHWIP
jgi:diaminopimelate epimerase